MARTSRPGEVTALGRFLIAVFIAAILLGGGYWWKTRSESSFQPAAVSATTEVRPPAKTDEPVRAEPAFPSQSAVPAAVQQREAGGSDDPYANLSTKEKKQ